jgi:hypothetical protein
MGGRMNFRNMSRYARYHEKSFDRNFSKEFDFMEFNVATINRITVDTKRYVVAYDPFFIEKSGKHTYGRESFWNGSNRKSEKGLEGNGFALIDVDTKTAYPLAVQQTPPKNEIATLTGNPEATRMDFYVHCALTHLQKLSNSELNVSVKHIAVDAYFSKQKFVSVVIEKGHHVVSKLRCDANLREAHFEKKLGRGRPKKYGAKVNVSDLKSFTYVEKITDRGDLYEGILYSINLKCNIRVAAFVPINKKKRALLLYFSTDLTLSARDIYDFYTARFQIEFAFRDGKQFVGLTECQARSKQKIHNHLNTSLTALLLAKIEETERESNSVQRLHFSMADHKRKKYNESLAQLIFSKLGLDESLIKSDPRFKDIVQFGVITC